MHQAATKLSSPDAVAQRADELFAAQRLEIYRRTDRLFALLMLIQWVAGIVAAVAIAPRTWSGTTSQTHIHVYAAIYLGALIAALPVALALLMPGTPLTRQVIAIAQMLFSSLLIHLTGGRIETHFHVFGSLAFLAVYRDWRVLITGSLVVGVDHFLRGMYWPQSVYGVIGGAEWRFLEHVAWVAFEDVFLIIATNQSLRQMRGLAERQAMLEAAKEQVEAAGQAKSAFLAHMSHEIRTPMTAILGYTDLLAAEGEDPLRRAEYLQTVHRNGEHLLSVLNDILDISKIEAGRLTVESAPCSPAEIACEIISLMRPRAAAKGLTLRIFFDGLIPQTILSDATRLRQVLLNLLSNAIKFTDTGHIRVTVKMLVAQNQLAFTVADTGIGLTESQRERLFQPFEQADGSTSRRYGGTGLGLVISKRLTEQLGGDIDVASAPGEGSTFTVTIAAGPLDGVTMVKYASEAVVLRDRPSTPESSSFDPLDGRILLADDSPDSRRLLKRILEKTGAVVETVDNGSEAVDRALANVNGRAFDLILMDMQMPQLDGYEATARLRRSGYTGRIMAVTAHASEADRAKCLAAGCDEYLAKPYDLGELLQTIRRQINSSRDGESRRAACAAQ